MKRISALLVAACAVTFAAPAGAQNTALPEGGGAARELPAYVQCAPYARRVSGIQLFGEAKEWWGQAQGRYATGKAPRVGAVMAFAPNKGMRSGHVAAVSRVIDSRHVLLDHANWSPINGRRGQVEKDVMAVDVSPAGDWSLVRVWYAPLGGVGTTAWPVSGFIYGDRAAAPAQPGAAPERSNPDFERAFAAFQ